MGGNPQVGRDRVRRLGQPDRGDLILSQAAPRRLSYLGGELPCTSTSSPKMDHRFSLGQAYLA